MFSSHLLLITARQQVSSPRANLSRHGAVWNGWQGVATHGVAWQGRPGTERHESLCSPKPRGRRIKVRRPQSIKTGSQSARAALGPLLRLDRPRAYQGPSATTNALQVRRWSRPTSQPACPAAARNAARAHRERSARLGARTWQTDSWTMRGPRSSARALARAASRRTRFSGVPWTAQRTQLLLGVGNRTLMPAHAAAASPLKVIARRTVAPDFRSMLRFKLSDILRPDWQ